MIILITGASGFIGHRLADALRAAGHAVIAVTRRAENSGSSIVADFTQEFDSAYWLPRLAGVDVVINAIGILREQGGQTFEKIHTRAPQALFAACAAAGVGKVIQISALGADHGNTGYFTSKRAADEFLASLPIAWTIVQPSLVFGEGGASAKLFTLLASLPVIPLPGGGRQPVQPIHIDDAIEAIKTLVETSAMNRRRVPLAGPEPVRLSDFLRRLRRRLQLSTPRFIVIPMALMRMTARIAGHLPGSLLDRETLAMLEAGNTAPAAATIQLLKRPPRGVEQLIDDDQRDRMLREAQLAWLLPMLRTSIALVWIWTGIVSLGLYPVEQSHELLARVGIAVALAPLMLYGAAILDLLMGLATLFMSNRRRLWLLQLAIILGYSVIITVRLPEYWLHPYGPLSKNLVMLAAIHALYTLEPRRWNTSS